MAGILTFFLGPAGRVILIVLAFVAWTVYQRDQAADAAREECQAEQLQRTLDEIIRQRDAAQQALAGAERQRQETEREMDTLEEERNAILRELAERGAGVCDIPDDVLERLRNIR